MTPRPESALLPQQKQVSEAVILMAGSGSRLRGADNTFLKPLVQILGRPLISYTVDALLRAGIKKINAVVGFEGERLSTAVMRLIPSGIEFCAIKNPEWQKLNGISLLAAKDRVAAPFLLTMSDHLFDDVIIDLLLNSPDRGLLNVAVDRKLDSIFDLDDAMKLQTREDRVVAIGKNLRAYDAIDTGLFICPLEIFEYFERARQHDDCSLADGVRLMAEEKRVRAVDIGDAWWQDVDTPEMLQRAEEVVLKRTKSTVR